jgi:hypothetical protein
VKKRRKEEEEERRRRRRRSGAAAAPTQRPDCPAQELDFPHLFSDLLPDEAHPGEVAHPSEEVHGHAVQQRVLRGPTGRHTCS